VSNCTKSFPNCHITLTQTSTAGETTAPSNQTLSPPLVRAPAEAPARVFAEHAPPRPVLEAGSLPLVSVGSYHTGRVLDNTQAGAF
jgi:hypothetical protein